MLRIHLFIRRILYIISLKKAYQKKKSVQLQIESFPLGSYMSKEKSGIIMEVPYSQHCNKRLCKEAQ